MSRVTEVNLTDSGGAFSLIYNIQKNLYDRGKSEVIFDYFSMGKFEKKEIISNIEKMGGEIYSADLRHNRLIGFIHLPIIFYKYCKKNKIETVHIHSDSAYILQAYSIPAKLAGVRNIIAHSHCAGMNGDYRKIKIIVHGLVRNFIDRSVNIYLSCSDLATKWMYANKLQEKAIFIKNGVDISKFRFDQKKRKQYRNDLNIKSEIIALATVGDFGYQKNPIFMCNVMKYLGDKYKLFFIGDGAHKDDVKKYVVENGLTTKVIFLGRKNVSEILNAMDIFVMPSRFEGLPVSGVEAQANGLPCLFSNEITKQVGILKSSFFYDIKSPLEWANKIKSIQLNIRDRTELFEVVKYNGFDIQDTADNLYDIYRSLK